MDSYGSDRVHQEKRRKKLDKILTLRALLEMWEARDDADHQYVLELRSKLRSAENQYAAMKI